MTPTLRDLLLQLGLDSYHPAFLETGVTEESVPELLKCEEGELNLLLQSISNMLPFHRVKFLKGIRELREATIQRQQAASAGTSSNHFPISLTLSDSPNLQLSCVSTSPTIYNHFAHKLSQDVCELVVCSLCSENSKIRDFGKLKLCIDCIKRIYISSDDAAQLSPFPTSTQPRENIPLGANTGSPQELVPIISSSPFSVTESADKSYIASPNQNFSATALTNLGQNSSIAIMPLTTQSYSSSFDRGGHSEVSGLDDLLDAEPIIQSLFPNLEPTDLNENSLRATGGSMFSPSGLTDVHFSRRSKKCDRCASKKIRCWRRTILCESCRAVGKACTFSRSRKKNPGTCRGCAERRIPCVGDGDICFACQDRNTPQLCKPRPRKLNLNLALDDESSSHDSRGNTVRGDDFDGNEGSRKNSRSMENKGAFLFHHKIYYVPGLVHRVRDRQAIKVYLRLCDVCV